jgi:hypothetical protein
MDPNAMKAINDALGTRVDFAALGRFEGGQLLKGYILMSKGKVAGISGVTVCTGVDLGQQDEKWLDGLGLLADLQAKLRPYLGVRQQAAVDLLARTPLAVTLDEANALDGAVQKQFLVSTLQSWNANREDGTPGFTQLTQAQQTVLLSRTYHQGVEMPDTAVAQPFYKAALEGRWQDAEQALRNYNVTPDWYKNRVNQEADLLRKEREAALS